VGAAGKLRGAGIVFHSNFTGIIFVNSGRSLTPQERAGQVAAGICRLTTTTNLLDEHEPGK